MAFDPTKYAGAGMADIPQSGGLPELKVIQKGSPEFDETHKDYKDKKVENCRPGDIVLNGAVVKRPLRIVPLGTTALYAEFKAKKNGGGFVGHRPLEVVSDPKYRKGSPNTPEEFKEYLGENELQYNIIFAVKAFVEEKWIDAVFLFSSTELKDARAWGRLIKNSKNPMWGTNIPPIFANTYMVATSPRQNSKGSWFGWDITRPTDSAVTVEADLELFAGDFERVKLLLPKAGPVAPQKALAAPAQGTTEVVDEASDQDAPF